MRRRESAGLFVALFAVVSRLLSVLSIAKPTEPTASDDGPFVVNTEDGLFFPPGSLDDDGIETDTLLLTKTPTGRTKIVGYRDGPPEPSTSTPAPAGTLAPRKCSRARESSSRRARSERSSVAGDGGDKPRSSDDDEPEPPLGQPGRALRERPWLSIRIGFEGDPSLRVFASSAEDEARLWEWLSHSHALPRAAVVALSTFESLLDDREETS